MAWIYHISDGYFDKPHTWTYYSKYCYDMFMWNLKMDKSDQIKITHSLIRQCLMACKLPLVLDLTDVCKKIYKFPAKKSTENFVTLFT